MDHSGTKNKKICKDTHTHWAIWTKQENKNKVLYLNLLWKTPNVTSSPGVRFTGDVTRWFLTNVPYLEESFRVRVWQRIVEGRKMWTLTKHLTQLSSKKAVQDEKHIILKIPADEAKTPNIQNSSNFLSQTEHLGVSLLRTNKKTH